MTDKMREEFKSWARQKGMSLPVNDDIDYNDWTQLALDSWQASREALVIELPVWEPWHDPGYGQAIDECKDAIEAAGLKVKP